MTDNPDHIRQRFIEACGHATQTIGVGRIIGQVFAHLYLSREPQTLDDLCDRLGISKGSASTVVRQLENWSAIRRVWVKGDRKVFYETTDEFGKIFRKALVDFVSRTMETTNGLIADAEAAVKTKAAKSGKNSEDLAFIRDRIGRVKKFRDRAQYLWKSPVIRMLFK